LVSRRDKRLPWEAMVETKAPVVKHSVFNAAKVVFIVYR